MILVAQTKKPTYRDGGVSNIVVVDASFVRILTDDNGLPEKIVGTLASGRDFSFHKDSVENWNSILRNIGGVARKFGVDLGSNDSPDFDLNF